MKTNLFPTISNALEKLIDKNNYIDAFVNKCEGDAYRKWNDDFCGTLGEYHLNNDTTGNCASFTAFHQSSYTCEEFNRIDFYYIQKSCFLDLFTIYIKTFVVMNYNDEKIRYPYTLIISPIAVYKDFFLKSIKLIIELYPNALFINLANTEWYVHNISYIKEPMKYYELLFGYEGDLVNFNTQGDKSFDPLIWYSENSIS